LPYYWAMKPSYRHYQRLVVGAVILFVTLVLLQVNWLQKAVSFQAEETQQKLQRLVPDMALAINGIEHNAFHDQRQKISDIPLDSFEARINAVLDQEYLELDLSFAIYQDTIDGVFISNQPDHREALLASEIKSCISCIISFSIAKDIEQKADESEAEFRNRLMKNAQFQYFSPVKKLKSEKESLLWLAVYLPDALQVAMKTLMYVFVLNVLVLALLLALFYYLLRSLARHKQLSQVKDDFFNNMTHEFKTPLSSIRLASRVLKESDIQEKKAIYYSLIDKETKRMEQQVDQLLQLSLLDHKELALATQDVNLQSVIEEIPERLRLLLAEKHAQLTLDVQLDNVQIKGDADHLSNSLCNLVENSVKYSEGKVQIWISAYLQKNKKIIKIRDNGPGIPPNYQQQIFERFFRGQKSNQYRAQGFGIGLSYVKSIIEAHQGTIRLNSAYKQGCEFIIEL
jgi:hypothetical protein